ncbi:hypothetical protein TNCV_3389751 [Trichonephila clavipes]|nr:hypothetical protein TNCV_3389751 [Trichonephila clavipes]
MAFKRGTTDILIVYGDVDCNGYAARWLYQKHYPNKCVPHHSVTDLSNNPSTTSLGKSLGYPFALFSTNPSEEENRDIQINLLYIVEIF